MKLTKRTLRKLIKEEFKTSRLNEFDKADFNVDAVQEVDTADLDTREDAPLDAGQLSSGDLAILQQLQDRFRAIAMATDPSGKDVELSKYRGQLTAVILKIERMITGEKGSAIKPTRQTKGRTSRELRNLAKNIQKS